jgi:glycosyltransferase involved in cell wall biosynthesis
MVVAEMRAGGAERLVATLARHVLAEHGDVTVASSGGWLAEQLEGAGARLVDLPLRGHRVHDLASSALALRRAAAACPADVLHAHNVKAAAVAAALARPRRAPMPILVTLHGLPDARYPAAARILSRCADELVAVSQPVLDRILSAGFPSARARVIENAVAPPAPHPRRKARQRLGLANDVPVVLCLARFTPQKRQDLLVTAWDDVDPRAVLLLAGDGETRPAIERAIARGSRADRIRLLGERRDPDWLLAAADVCVLPTDWEGLPISVLEAMSAGVPVVASAVPGVEHLGAAAVELIRPGSADALGAGLQHVLGSERRRRDMTRAAMTLIGTRFGIESMWLRYRDRYEALRRRPFVDRAGAGESP